MGEARPGTRSRATRVSAAAWGVVLDAGRRADVPDDIWAELADRGMAKGAALTSTWQQVSGALGTAPTIEVLARHAELRHQTRVTVLGKVAVMATRRVHAGPDGMTGEPVVLVQVLPPGEVVTALVPHLPPVADLRVDDGAMGSSPIAVPVEELWLDSTTSLGGPAVGPTALRLAGDEPGTRAGWLTADELRTDPTRESVLPDRDAAAGVGHVLDEAPGDRDLQENEVLGLLRGVPGLDPRLVDLAASAQSEVTVTLSPGRTSPASGEEAIAMLDRFALRHWVVTEHGLVCVRVDRGGFDVLGVAPGDLAREIRSLVAGDLPDALDLQDHLGGSA